MSEIGEANIKEAVNQLKNRLSDELENDTYEDESVFLRFLKARDFNIDCAEKMLREHVEWRKKYDIKNKSKWKHPEVLEKYLPFNKVGYDKEGCLVRYIPSGDIDWIGLNSSCKRDTIAKWLIQYYEEDMEDLKRQSLKLQKTIDKVIYIHDVGNLTFTQSTDKNVISNFVFFISMYENQYPETMKALYAINAPSYFGLLFSLLKKFIPVAVLKKVSIYSDDSYKEDLLKIIDPEVLPAFLGGKRTDLDGNPQCLSFINYGGPVPEKYFIHRNKRSLANIPDINKITIANASFHEEFLEVEEPNSYLEWEIEVQSRDIGFGLFYKGKDENQVELVPVQRINTDDYAESGVCKCVDVGTYVIVFDNTYSLLRSKVVYFKVKILKSEDEASLLMQQ